MKGQKTAAVLSVLICVVTRFTVESRAADDKAEKPKPAATQKQRGEVAARRDPGAWGYHPWHDQWHQGYWTGAGWGWGSPWRWGWNGPWAWGFTGPGPGKEEYDNPFCGKCQP